MCVCVCLCVCVYIYMCVCVCVCVYKNTVPKSMRLCFCKEILKKF